MNMIAAVVISLALLPTAASAAGDDFPSKSTQDQVRVVKGSIAEARKTWKTEPPAQAAAAETPREEKRSFGQEVSTALKADALFEKFVLVKQGRIEKDPAGQVCAVFDQGKPAAAEPGKEMLFKNYLYWRGGVKPMGCVLAGDYCSSSIWCCGASLCIDNICTGGSPGDRCIPRGKRCSGTIWCCDTGLCMDGYCQ